MSDDGFSALRPRLFGIAYRILGSVADAEDVVQDAWLRWQGADRETVRSPEAYLSTIATRLSINMATTARARREVYPGPWLPEPIDTSADPALGAERAELVDLAVLVLLERLTPLERAVFVLREAFEYPYRQIAEIVEVSESNARQIGKRARDHVNGQRRETVARAERDRLLRVFVAAAYTGDLDKLESLLSASVMALSDGGGKVNAARVPVHGIERVARYLAGVVAKFAGGSTVEFVELNNSDAVVISVGDAVIGVCALSVAADGIDGVFTMVNPDKIGHLSPRPVLVGEIRTESADPG